MRNDMITLGLRGIIIVQASRYKIQELIDTQGAVSTYQALDTLSNEPVLYYQYIAEPIDNAVQILSDNIPDILNVDFISGVTHVVTSYPPTKQRLKERLSDSELEQFLLDTAQALEDASDAGVIHGDIRPERFLFDGEKYLIEGYGIRWEFMPSRYSAPEKKQSAAGDIYAWAKTVGAFIPFSVPKVIAELLERCLDKDPKNRPLPEDIVDELSTFFLQVSQDSKHPTLLNLKQTIAEAQPDLLDSLFTQGMSDILTSTQERFSDSNHVAKASKLSDIEASVVVKATTDEVIDDSGKLSTADLASSNLEAASELRNSQADISGQNTESLPEVSSSARITDATVTTGANQSISNENSLIASSEETAVTKINTDAPELDTIDQGLAAIANADTVEDDPFLSKENFADLQTQGAVESLDNVADLDQADDGSDTAIADSVESNAALANNLTDDLVIEETVDDVSDTEITGLEAIELKATYHDLSSTDLDVPESFDSIKDGAEFDLVKVEADVLDSALDEIVQSKAAADLKLSNALDPESQAIENIFAEEKETKNTTTGFDVSDLDFSGNSFNSQENESVADSVETPDKNIGTHLGSNHASNADTSDFDATSFDLSNFDANSTAAGVSVEETPVTEDNKENIVATTEDSLENIKEDVAIVESVEANDSSESTAFSVDELDFNDFAISKTQAGLDTFAHEEQLHLQALQDILTESDDEDSSSESSGLASQSIDPSDLMPHSTQLERAFEALSQNMYEESAIEKGTEEEHNLAKDNLTEADEALLTETLSEDISEEPAVSVPDVSNTSEVSSSESNTTVETSTNAEVAISEEVSTSETDTKSDIDLSLLDTNFSELNDQPALANMPKPVYTAEEFSILDSSFKEKTDNPTQDNAQDDATKADVDIVLPSVEPTVEGVPNTAPESKPIESKPIESKPEAPKTIASMPTDFRVADTDFVDMSGETEEFSILDTDFAALTDEPAQTTQEVQTDETQEIVMVSDVVPVVKSEVSLQSSAKLEQSASVPTSQQEVKSDINVFEMGIDDIDTAATQYATQIDPYKSNNKVPRESTTHEVEKESDSPDVGLTSFLEDVLDNKNDSLLVQTSFPNVAEKQSDLTLFPMYEQETMFAKDTVMLKDANETGIFSHTSFDQQEANAAPETTTNEVNDDLQLIELTDFGGSLKIDDDSDINGSSESPESASSAVTDENDQDKARAQRQARRAQRRAEAEAAQEEEIDVFKTAFGKIAMMEASIDQPASAAAIQEDLVKKTVVDLLSTSTTGNGSSTVPTVVDESKLTVFEAKHLSIAEKIAAKNARAKRGSASSRNTQQQLKQTDLGRGSRQAGQGPDVFGEDDYDAIGKLPTDTEASADLANNPKLTYFEIPQVEDETPEVEEAPKKTNQKTKQKRKGLFAKSKPKQKKAPAKKAELTNVLDTDLGSDDFKITAERQEEFNKALSTTPLRTAWRVGAASLVLAGTAAILWLALPGLKTAQSSFVEQASRTEANTIIGLNSDHVIYTQVNPASIEDMISVVVIKSPEGSEYPPEYVFDIFPNAPLSLDVKGEWTLQAKYQRSWSNLVIVDVPNLGGEAINFNFNVQ